MFCRGVSWFISIFLAVVVATDYSDTDFSTEFSTMEAVQEVEATVATQLGTLLDAGDPPVVTLVVGDTQMAAHRAVMTTNSPVSAAMFHRGTLEASSGQVAVPDVETPVLRQDPQLHGMAPQLPAVADKFSLPDPKAPCEHQLASQLSVETAAATAVLAVRQSCGSLRDTAVDFIKAHFFDVVGTQGWADMAHSYTEDLMEVSRLLSDPPAETRIPAATDSSPTPATQPHRERRDRWQIVRGALLAPAIPPTNKPDSTIVSLLKGNSEEEKSKRLMLAATYGDAKQLQALLAAGTDVGASDGFDMTPLHWAALRGNANAVRRLVEGGADVEARNGWQFTPLQLAAWKGRAAVVQLLVASSADPSPRNLWGWTPLHEAAWHGHADVAAVLLEAGADREATTSEGKTPLDFARQENHQQLIDMLT